MASLSDLERSQTRNALTVRGFSLAQLSFQTLGIIYSDIGTSPLYVLNGIWPASKPVPSREDVIGGISAIVWALTLLPLTKYVLICLRFGTHEGEGGAFALYQGLFPPKPQDPEFERTLTGDFSKSGSSISTSISKRLKWPLLVWSLLGTSLTLADGVFTPAVSVTSAVGGLAVAVPSVSSQVTPISIAFLVVLFLGQPFGTARLAFVFAPVTCVWLLLLGATGIANITAYPGIFRAFDPSRAVLLFVRTRDYDLLAGILLAITGCEALFANLGQFNVPSIQLSFSFFVYPCLLLAYLGQGARLISDGDAVISNIFYHSIPGSSSGPLFWIIYVFAILATLIASQAMITATFSLVQQLIKFKSMPPLRMVYTSETIQGQVYVPGVNWILMIAIVVVVAALKSSTALTNAYGFAVATVMFSTTVMISLQMRYVKRWPVGVALGFLVIFGFFDGLFWGAALKKVPEGAWVPLMIGCILMSLMIFWTWAKGLEDKFDGANRRNLRHFIVPKAGFEDVLQVRTDNQSGIADMDEISVVDDDQRSADSKADAGPFWTRPLEMVDSNQSTELEERFELARIPTCAIFHKLSGGKGVPHSFVGFLRQWPALPRVVVFLSVRVLPVARVSSGHRYLVDKVRSVEGFYGVTYYMGFREDFDVKVEDIISSICLLETRIHPHGSTAVVKSIQSAATIYTHIVPHYYVLSRKINIGRVSGIVNWIRQMLIEGVYRPMSTMFPETVNWSGPAYEMIRVGVNATI